MRAAQQPADGGHARVAGDGPARARERFAVVDHGANLEDRKLLAVLAGARLRVKCRPARSQPDREGRQQDHGKRQQRQQQRQSEIKETAYG